MWRARSSETRGAGIAASGASSRSEIGHESSHVACCCSHLCAHAGQYKSEGITEASRMPHRCALPLFIVGVGSA